MNTARLSALKAIVDTDKADGNRERTDRHRFKDVVGGKVMLRDTNFDERDQLKHRRKPEGSKSDPEDTLFAFDDGDDRVKQSE